MSISRSQWSNIAGFGIAFAGPAIFVSLGVWWIAEPTPRPSQGPAMTREDVVCDWPNRTIMIKAGIYDSSVIRAVELCGWIVDGGGTITINGSGATTTEGHVETHAATFSVAPSQWKVPDTIDCATSSCTVLSYQTNHRP